MPVFGHIVRSHAFIAFSKKKLNASFAPGSADATEAVSDNSGGFNEFGTKQRHRGQQNAGGIAPRRGDKVRIPDGFAVQFRHAVNRLLQKRRHGMRATIKFLINFGVIQPEISGEIDDLDFGID